MQPIPDTWSMGTFSRDNIEGLVRFNTGLEIYIGNPKYPFRIGIAVPIESFDTVDFYDFEDFIFDVFQAENRSIVCTIITSSAFKEVVLYTSDKDVLENNLPSFREAFPTLKVTSYFEEDKDWELYSDLIKSN